MELFTFIQLESHIGQQSFNRDHQNHYRFLSSEEFGKKHVPKKNQGKAINCAAHG